MSMSTKIDDLPGPIPDDVKHDINVLQGEMTQNVQTQKPVHLEKEYVQVENNQSNITVDIKKKSNVQENAVLVKDNNVQQNEDFMSMIKNQINEDNLLLCVIIFMATYPPLTGYVQNIPLIGSYATGDIITGLIKTVVLIVLFIIAKIYILPRIRI